VERQTELCWPAVAAVLPFFLFLPLNNDCSALGNMILLTFSIEKKSMKCICSSQTGRIHKKIPWEFGLVGFVFFAIFACILTGSS